MTACAPGSSERVLGADRDGRGCVASAGFSWSGVRGECIRIFEIGLAFVPEQVPAQGAVLAAHVVMAPVPDAQPAAEVFVPGRAGAIPLFKPQAPSQGAPWLVNAQEGVAVFREPTGCLLEVRGQMFRSTGGRFTQKALGATRHPLFGGCLCADCS